MHLPDWMAFVLVGICGLVGGAGTVLWMAGKALRESYRVTAGGAVWQRVLGGAVVQVARCQCGAPDCETVTMSVRPLRKP